MYIPSSFRVAESDKLAAFMQAHSFATLVTCQAGVPFASHLPIRFLPHEHRLVSHLARANPQWQHFADGVEVLAIFTGPHSYISPSWYSVEEAVPTWNYAAVHAYGVPTVIDDHDRIVSLLAETVEFYEKSFANPWPGILPDEYRDRMIQAIVAFEIQVTRIEGKFKLGQNRSSKDLQGVFNALASSRDDTQRALAELMKEDGLINDPLDGGPH